jgi:hypothetical protein
MWCALAVPALPPPVTGRPIFGGDVRLLPRRKKLEKFVSYGHISSDGRISLTAHLSNLASRQPTTCITSVTGSIDPIPWRAASPLPPPRGSRPWTPRWRAWRAAGCPSRPVSPPHRGHSTAAGLLPDRKAPRSKSPTTQVPPACFLSSSSSRLTVYFSDKASQMLANIRLVPWYAQRDNWVYALREACAEAGMKIFI